ncbi:MAG: hypothetical protein RL407_1473 [Bacteroidota bacterium]|jgi:uncharacterized protein (DUF1015 family)
MAEILPIRAWRYGDDLAKNMEALTAPLFDVVSQKQRDILYKNPINSIHLSVPQGPDPANEAKKLLKKWKAERVLIQDNKPGIYVYYQYFRLPGEEMERCRKGFIAHIKAYDWDEREILRHEQTIHSAVSDRIDLLRATEIQASPTHGLYEDEGNELEGLMDLAMENPLYDLEDYQGVREVLGVITDPKAIAKFVATLSSKKVILADGHHRLEAAITYRKEMAEMNKDLPWKGADYHLMYLTNIHGNHLKILPTHRLYYSYPHSKEKFLDDLEPWFESRYLGDAEELSIYAFQRKWSFGLIWGDAAYVIKFRPEKFSVIAEAFPEALRELDVVILHYILFYKILGLSLEDQRHSAHLAFERNFSRCLHEVESGIASFAVITREVDLKQVVEVCRSGHVMPQKSTYFYPKAVGGLLFGSIKQEEFDYDYAQFFI